MASRDASEPPGLEPTTSLTFCGLWVAVSAAALASSPELDDATNDRITAAVNYELTSQRYTIAPTDWHDGVVVTLRGHDDDHYEKVGSRRVARHLYNTMTSPQHENVSNGHA